jgi:hypothetical protein
MNSFNYDSDLIGGSLQVRESRVVADLLLQEASSDQWYQAIISENQLQKRSPATAKRVAQALRKRLERLEPPFWRAIRDGDDELATQATFCAVMARNLLLVEWMETVTHDAISTHAGHLKQFQWSEFLEDRVQRDQRIAAWTESSRKKMGQVVFRILAEVGLLSDTRSLNLQKLIIRPEIRQLLEHHGHQRLLTCLELSTR